ncbi:PDZ domain-containing protein [Hydrogenimonas sp. SS33]|uniref:PDZ domain-containing protein n=1 Tax=Hydrogenimonas leucolamina TaxID=2954236 RepID=UPI00336C0F5E
MKPVSEKALFAAVAAGIVLTAAVIAASLIDLFLPPLPHLECRQSAAWPKESYRFAAAFGLQAPKPVQHTKKRATAPVVNLHGYQLTMTAVGKPSMAIIVHNHRSKLLGIGESIDGFVLKEVYTDRVRLEKNGRTYWLSMKKKKSSTIRTQKAEARSAKSGNPEEMIRREGNTYYVPRELLTEMHDLRKIFKYIAIRPIYRNNRIIGYGITQVKKGSVFDKMGLRKRDIIQKVNGKPVTNEAEAFKYFNNIGELSSLTLTIKRGHRILELNYEVF